jgi:hypothetical protein
MRFTAASILLIVSGVALHAEPSRSVQYLMKEPLTLFAWGILQLENRAKAFAWSRIDVFNQFANVDYDWDKNQLALQMTIYPRYRSLQKITSKEVCGEVIQQIKYHFGVAPGSEFMHDIGGVGTFFTHKQFVKAGAPETLAADIERMTIIRIDVFTSPTDKPPFRPSQSCSSDLLKQEIQYFTTSPR